MSPARVVLLGYREQLEQAAPGCPRRVAGSVWRGRCHSRETRTSYGRIDLIMVKNHTGPSFHNFIRMEQYILGHIVNLMCYRMHIDSNQMVNLGLLGQAPPAHAVQILCPVSGFPRQSTTCASRPVGRPAAGLIPGRSQHPKRPEPQDDRICEINLRWGWRLVMKSLGKRTNRFNLNEKSRFGNKSLCHKHTIICEMIIPVLIIHKYFDT